MFVKKFDPSYSAQDIIIRTDQDGGDVSKTLDSIGYNTPLIRVGEYTFTGDDIERFSFNVGQSFLPKASISILDKYDKFKEALRPKIDILTIYFSARTPQEYDGSPSPESRDQYYHKIDMLITNVNVVGKSVMLGCEYYSTQTDTLYTVHTRIFDTAKDAIEKISKECGLGLILWYGYEYPELEYKIIQDGCSNIKLLQRIASWGKEHSKTWMFIDNLMFLNIVDIIKAYQDKSPDISSYDHISRTIVDSYPITFDNRVGFLDDKEKYKKLKISEYFHSDAHSQLCNVIPENDVIDVYALDTFEKSLDSIEVGYKEELLSDGYTQLVFPTELQTILNAEINQPNLDNKLKQLSKLIIEPQYFMPQLYSGMTISIELYNQMNTNEYDSQKTEDFTAVANENTNKYETRYKWYLNDLLSGIYLVTNVEYIATFGKNMKQRITCTFKNDFMQ